MTRRRSLLRRLGRALALILLLGAVGGVAVLYLRWRWREQRYNPLIEEMAAAQGVDPFLVKAVMRQESSFDPTAYSAKGAIGLMQVMPGTGEQWARATGRTGFKHDALWDPRTNIEAGTWILAQALERWQTHDDPVPFALAEYNAGAGRVVKWLPHGEATTAEEFVAAITFPGVRRYIERITGYAENYRAKGEL